MIVLTYTALYREWRPKTFNDVVGQEHITTTLKNQILNNRIAHAYLFCGTRGTGKTSTAKVFAKALNCLNLKEGEPCNKCEMCRKINEGLAIDVTELDAASNNGVDKIRDIIDDVKNHRSQLGILYLSHFNREVIQSILKKEHLTFTKLFEAKPHVFVSKTNPLSNKKLVKMEDLENYPRLTYEQGINNSFYFSEELHSTQPSKKSIVVSDRATLFNLLIGLDGYTISSGILSTDLNGNNIVSIPLDSDEVMEIGYISDGVLSNMAKNYLNHLIQYIEQTK